MMVQVGDMRVMDVLADATNVIAEGEVLQLMNCNDPDTDESRYLQVIRYKTAKLFEASARLAAILCRTSPGVEEAAAAYGRHLGTAFQLVDDILDYDGESETIGKNPGDDLREGKPTLPLIRVLEVGTDTERALVREAIENANGERFDEILAAVRRTGALDYARQKAIDEAGLARAAMASIGSALPGPHADALSQLARLAVERIA